MNPNMLKSGLPNSSRHQKMYHLAPLEDVDRMKYTITEQDSTMSPSYSPYNTAIFGDMVNKFNKTGRKPFDH